MKHLNDNDKKINQHISNKKRKGKKCRVTYVHHNNNNNNNNNNTKKTQR